MFDTHCHLNFKVFEKDLEQVINNAKKTGVNNIVVPGTDVETSKKAVELAEKFEGIYAAVGIHPHNVFQINQKRSEVGKIEKLLSHPKIVAVGEIGVDRHFYQKTKHENYQVNQEFIDLQKEFFIEQIKLAHKYKKALIIHNREAKKDVLEILNNYKLLITNYLSVFHCCEPDDDLLEFAKKHKIYIGVDGDVTYNKKKQEFVKKIPLELLVLETDSPFLLPEPLRSQKKYPNEPKNLPLIDEFVAKLLNSSINPPSLKLRRASQPARNATQSVAGGLIKITTENAERLFLE